MLKPWDDQEDADENGPSASKKPKTKYVNVHVQCEKAAALLCGMQQLNFKCKHERYIF